MNVGPDPQIDLSQIEQARRQINRLRKRRTPGIPREYELGSGSRKYRRCPQFRLKEVQEWLDSRALW